MLSQIKRFFEKQPIATLAQVASAIHTDPDALLPMLEHFERKGCLKCLSQKTDGCATSGQSSCQGCPASGCHSSKTASLLYQWVKN